jgi:hypothetical protein
MVKKGNGTGRMENPNSDIKLQKKFKIKYGQRRQFFAWIKKIKTPESSVCSQG